MAQVTTRPSHTAANLELVEQRWRILCMTIDCAEERLRLATYRGEPDDKIAAMSAGEMAKIIEAKRKYDTAKGEP